MTDKLHSSNQSITLLEGDRVVTNPHEVSMIFNDYFTEVARELSEPHAPNENTCIHKLVESYKDHPSILAILANNNMVDNDHRFEF